MPEFLISDAINSQNMRELQDFLTANPGPVTLRIQSGGGDLLPAIAASNAIARHGQVTSISDGTCGSAATALCAASKTSRGVSTCVFLLHSPHCAAEGDSTALFQAAKALDAATDSLKAIYRTKIHDESRLAAAMSGDTWLTAQEAKDIGLIDELVASGDPQANAFSVGAGTGGFSPSSSGLVGNPASPPFPSPFPSMPAQLATPTTHSAESRLRAASDGLLIRAGILPDDGKNPYRSTPMREMGTAIQAATGGFADGVDAFSRALGDSANRAMGIAFNEDAAEEPWRIMAETVLIKDFRETSLAGLSQFPSAPEIRENSEIEVAHLADTAEKASLGTYGQLFHISRRALVNDDVGYFAQLTRNLGESTSRAVGDALAALVLTKTHGVTLSDGYALFHTNHKNAGTGRAVKRFADRGVQLAGEGQRPQRGYKWNTRALAVVGGVVGAGPAQCAFR